VYVCVVCVSMVDDVAPPLPIKQRCKSAISELGSSSQSRNDGTVSSSQRHTVSNDCGVTVPPPSWQHSADMSSLDSVLAELSQSASPMRLARGAHEDMVDGQLAAVSGLRTTSMNCARSPAHNDTNSSSSLHASLCLASTSSETIASVPPALPAKLKHSMSIAVVVVCV